MVSSAFHSVPTWTSFKFYSSSMMLKSLFHVPCWFYVEILIYFSSTWTWYRRLMTFYLSLKLFWKWRLINAWTMLNRKIYNQFDMGRMYVLNLFCQFKIIMTAQKTFQLKIIMTTPKTFQLKIIMTPQKKHSIQFQMKPQPNTSCIQYSENNITCPA